MTLATARRHFRTPSNFKSTWDSRRLVGETRAVLPEVIMVDTRDKADATPRVPEGHPPGGLQQVIVSTGGHLIVVANRLPVTINADPTAEGGYRFKESSGGLATALAGCKKYMDFIWIGWPGFDVPEIDREFISKKLQTDHACKPVYLSAEISDRYYNGFSNSILWPLFHYHPGEMSFDDTDWLAYRQVNLLFAEAIQKEVQSGDIVWVQDYHLCLVPLFLRDLLGRSPTSMGEGAQQNMSDVFNGLVLGPGAATPEMSSSGTFSTAPTGVNGTHSRTVVNNVLIGFFIHTPFPSSEVFRVLPVRKEILLGMLHCDLIGFHTYDYARHFLSSVSRLLGLKCLPNSVELVGRRAFVGAFPIGIDPSTFVDALQRSDVKERINALRRRFEGVKVIVGVDRLDYIKGVPQKMHALEVFLEDHPEWIGKVVLVQLAVPSRGDVEEYQKLRANINELVGRINGRFGTVEFMPIHFMHRSIPHEELCALYAISDACLVTSTRDGMNLVSYEYVSSQTDSHGVLILSEFAGASHSLNGALIVNPWDTAGTADAINQALTMSPADRKTRFNTLSGYVNKFTAAHWGMSFVAEVQNIDRKRKQDADKAEQQAGAKTIDDIKQLS